MNTLNMHALTKTNDPKLWVRLIDNKTVSAKFFKDIDFSHYDTNWKGLFDVMAKLEDERKEISAVSIMLEGGYEMLKLYVICW